MLSLTGCGLMLAAGRAGSAESKAEAPDFNFHIRPILAAHCLRCHGQDAKQRKGDLRLDVREDAIAAGALEPGNLAKSSFWEHIITTDPDEVMPPPKEKRPLSAEQKALLKRWIEAGAPYEKHWAFIPPVKPAVPAVPEASLQPRNFSPIDHFILAKLAEKKIQPAAESSREDWLRRVTLDLTGLPPSLAEMDAFLNDASPLAYERVTDRLLASPAYGERMANDWLDVARYADTYGRHEDADCTTWPYRDWLIRAFNDNLSYADFLLWQTAGDMLPEPTKDQMIATCFNRLPQQSNEAGSNAEEFRIEQVADRLRTNGLAFLGLSVECARCHDHKYDPITMRDYYQMAAMFNNIDELGLFCVYTGGVPPPSILLLPPDKETRFSAAKKRIAELERKGGEMLPAARERFAEFLKGSSPPQAQHPPAAKPLAHYAFESLEEKVMVNAADPAKPGAVRLNAKLFPGRVGMALEFKQDNAVFVKDMPRIQRCDPFSYGVWLKPGESTKRSVVAHCSRSGIDSASRGYEIILVDDVPEFALVHFNPGNEIRLRAKEKVPLNQWTHLAATYDGSSRAAGMRLYINGRLADTEVVRDNLYRDIIYRADWGDDVGAKDSVGQLGVVVGGRHNDASYKNGLVDEFFFDDRELSAPEIAQWALLIDKSQPEDWFEWYLREKDEPWRALQKELHQVRREENELSGEAIDLMVMKEWSGPRRPTHILNRGQFDQPKEEVQPGVIAGIMPLQPEYPQNRLGFAKWLLDPKHPLTSRVAVNRTWQMFFGRGLVLTTEDFGTQGQLPSHPELLDWLAVTFMENGWDLKRLCREIVLSATYRQAAQPADPRLLQEDPENRLLARGPRQRLSAEQIRDLILEAAGLLVGEIGGPSVKPYQPAGLWEDSGTQHTYVQDNGSKLYRRSMYTFWRRTMPPPTMTVFDAPTREFCKVRRERTATPLQSLVLMNDPQLIEAARILAERLVAKYPDRDSERAREAYRLLTSHAPGEAQLRVVESYLAEERQRLGAEPKQAEALLAQNGELPVNSKLPMNEVAATAMMVRMLLGFSETTVKP